MVISVKENTFEVILMSNPVQNVIFSTRNHKSLTKMSKIQQARAILYHNVTFSAELNRKTKQTRIVYYVRCFITLNQHIESFYK